MEENESYLGELCRNWRVLLAASLGMAVGLQLFSIITSLFAPFLIKDFAWTRAQFAQIGFTMIAAILASPVAGWLTDRYGARKMALIGVILLPLVVVAFSQQTGNFGYYFVCSFAVMIVGSVVGPVTYTRLIVERFKRARGLALTIVMSAPALSGILLPRLITQFIADNGWKAAYWGLAGLLLVLGLIAIALIPADAGRPGDRKASAVGVRGHAFREVLTAPVFWILAVAIFLTTIHTPLHGSQFIVLLNEQGLSAMAAATMLQIYSFGTLVGRISCGLALDRFSARIVAMVSMILPAFGLALLASPLDSFGVVAAAVLLVGVTVGAEGDLLSFLVSRYFRMEIFSTALALTYCAMFVASLSGVSLLRIILQGTNSFSVFLWLTAGAVLVGSLLFLRLPAVTPAARHEG